MDKIFIDTDIALDLLSERAPDNKIIDLSLNSVFKDFEDAIQYYTATENRIDILLTRNLKNYKAAQITVMTAKDYLLSA